MSADVPPDPRGTKPVPWHAKLLIAAASIYIAMRVVQMVSWLFD